MSSINYYDKNAKEFYDRTINVDLQELHQIFLENIPKNAKILDAGCGVGRDSRLFLEKGYDVVSFDGSLEMVKLASHLLERNVRHMLFQDVDFSNAFDAIWANASLLHVPYEDLNDVLKRLHKALVPSGILYASFKYGSTIRHVEERIFFDMNEISIMSHLKGLFTPLKIWKNTDTRSIASSPDKSWLQLIAKRLED